MANFDSISASYPAENPYTPGAGHEPPFLAGRTGAKEEFAKSLRQKIVLENVVLTGLRGVGKTVLLKSSFSEIARQAGWQWTDSNIDEDTSSTNHKMALRLIADFSTITSSVRIIVDAKQVPGFGGGHEVASVNMDYDYLMAIYKQTPGLVSDKLKGVLEAGWKALEPFDRCKGIVFAYDEAQNLADRREENQHPLSLLLDVFQSIQTKKIPFMLVLTGLPTLFPKLVDARTYAERMFHLIELGSLDEEASRDAILKPVQRVNPPPFDGEIVEEIQNVSNGYPYFIQFVCREAFESRLNNPEASVPMNVIIDKLDRDFFSGRWEKATDRQRDLLEVIAHLDGVEDGEFTVQDIMRESGKRLTKPIKNSSHVSQMLSALVRKGLVYRNRHGKYILAVPLLAPYIRRKTAETEDGG